MWREEAHSQRGSRELLSRPERTQRAGGDGSDGAGAVVRALTGGAELRAVDWRSGGDSGQASAEAEERPSGCGTSIAVTGGGSLSMWQASRQLSGTDSVRGIDWRPATPRAHQQARQHTLAFLADRVGSRRRTLRSRLAASVPAPGNASWPSDRQGRDGPQAGGATVLDVAQGMGLSANFEVRFARGVAWSWFMVCRRSRSN